MQRWNMVKTMFNTHFHDHWWWTSHKMTCCRTHIDTVRDGLIPHVPWYQSPPLGAQPASQKFNQRTSKSVDGWALMDNGYSFELLMSYQSISLVGCFRGFKTPFIHPTILILSRLRDSHRTFLILVAHLASPQRCNWNVLILHWNIIDGDLPS